MVLISPRIGFASGFKTSNHGAKATAMGNAFTATADDLSAMAYNPAGLTESMGTNTYLGATAVIPSYTYTSPSGTSEDGEDIVFFPFHFYISSDFDAKNMVFGLGVFSPFGLGTKWDEKGLVRFNATESTLETVVINPTVAWKLLPTLSIGAGVDYMYSKASLESMVDQSLFGAGDGHFIIEGDGDGWGYNIGVLFTPTDRLRLGLAYRSRIKVDYSGSADLENIAPSLQPLFGGSSFSTGGGTSIEFPDVISAGIAYNPTERLKVELDLEWTLWSSYQSFVIDMQNEVPAAGFVDIIEDKNWRDVGAIKVGVEYRASERFSLRAGYVYDNSPVPESTLQPRLPDSDQQNISLGLGYSRERFNIDLVYIAVIYEERDVNNSILSGEYETSASLVGVSAGYGF
ncbi:MAG: OmpP1/FadL family transporter [Thermodesulfobacteriota bacterium]